MKLHNLIFIGMVVGVLVGVGLNMVHDPSAEEADARAPGEEASLATQPSAEPDDTDAPAPDEEDRKPPIWYGYVMWVLDLLGPTLFMGALKMIIAPLIFASIVAGVTSLPHVAELGAIGWKTLAYYITTTTIAVTIGLAAVLLIQPGNKSASAEIRDKELAEQERLRVRYEATQSASPLDAEGNPTPTYVAWMRAQKRASAGEQAGRYESKMQAISGAEGRTPGEIFTNDIVRPLLMNPFQSLSANPPNALGIIFFALLLGIACAFVGEPAAPVVRFFQGLNEVIMRITHWLMQIAPVAIGCIVAKLVAETGPGVFVSLGWYCATVLIGIGVHFVVLIGIAKFVGGVSPVQLYRGLREAFLIALTTRSSAATLPVTIANVTEKLKVSPKVANFSLPLGATMNMDGTALYEGIAVIFLIQIFGGLDDVQITMTAMTTLLIFITAVLASVGAAAVPNAGLVTMVIVASAVNLPIYYIPFIFAVDAVLDMFRTSTNVLGDSVGAVVVNRLEAGRLSAAAA